MEIYKLNLRKAALAAMPRADRTLLFLLGHTTNEINVLHKIMLAMMHANEGLHEVKIIQSGQTLIVMRLLIGKLHEGWELFKDRVQANKDFRESYLANLPANARESIKALNVHFGKGSPLTAIRNKLSFHNADEHELLEGSFNALPATEPWQFYLGEQLANTFYYASEMVVTKAAADLAGGYEKLFELTLVVAHDELQLFEEVLAAVVLSRLPDAKPAALDIGPTIRLSDAKLPFFMDVSPG